MLINDLLNSPLNESELAKLTAHELNVMALLSTLAGAVQGFPDNERKLYNVTRAWARFMSLDPYHVHIDPQVAEYMSEEEKARFAWKEGVVPGEWLVQQIMDSCEWFPAPVVAREMYCAAGFPPLDGLTPDKLSPLAKRKMNRGGDE